MARLLGPDANSRLVYSVVGARFATQVGATATVYADAAGTVLADIATYDGTNTPGAAITGSTLTVDANSLLPRFWFPDGQDVVYVKVGGGPITAVNADYDARLDAVVAGGGGGGGAVASVNGQTGVVNLTASDVSADAAGAASTAVSNHVAASDPHGDRAWATTQLAGKADLVGGVIPTAQLPVLAISDVYTVASQAAMLALTAQRGDVAVRTDVNATFILAADDPTVLANWVELPQPASGVTTVNGQSGVVVLAAGDVGAIATSAAGAAGGVATLNGASRVPAAQLGQSPVTLTYAATIATDASLGNQFKVTLTGNPILGNPTGATDGQMLMWAITQDATGGRSMTPDTKFRFGGDLTSIVLSTTPGKTDYLTARYNGVSDTFDVVAFVRGY